MILDSRKRRTNTPSFSPTGLSWSRLLTSSNLGVNITNKLSWSKHTKTVVKRAQQSQFPLRRLKRFGMGPQSLKKLYSCAIKSVLTGSITAWYGNCSASDHKTLRWWCEWPSTSLGPSFLTSRTSIPGGVRGRPYKLWKTPANLVIDCSPCYHTASGTGAPSLGPKWLLNSFKWLPRTFALPSYPLFYAAATLCLLSMHSHFNNSTYL